MSFGQINHTGWREMTAILDPGQPWPAQHISGSNNGTIDYPISFEALVLDDAPDSFSGVGTIGIDNLTSKTGVSVSPTATTSSPTATPTPTPGSADIEFQTNKNDINVGDCVEISWKTANVKEVYYQNGGVTGAETKNECPTQTTTYTLRVVKQDGSQETKSIEIKVTGNSPTQPAVIKAFDHNLTDWDSGYGAYVVTTNQCVDFSWDVEGATRGIVLEPISVLQPVASTGVEICRFDPPLQVQNWYLVALGPGNTSTTSDVIPIVFIP